MFEPNNQALAVSGITAFESLVSFDQEGYAVIPLHNYHGSCVTLNGGISLGLVRECEAPTCSLPLTQDVWFIPEDVCDSEALVESFHEDTGRFERLLEVLGISPNKLTPDQMLALKDLLHDYCDIIAIKDQELGCTDIVCHSIDSGEHRPIKQQPYHTAIVHRDTIRKMVEQMQKQGIVQPSRSPWASPVVLVPKKDGSLHFCVDYCKLNSITRKDVFSLPRVDDILDTLNGARYFSSLDFASGYWQIEDARAKSAFTTYNGLYEFDACLLAYVMH